MIILSLTTSELARAKIADQQPDMRFSEHDGLRYAEIDVDGYKVLIDENELAALNAWFNPPTVETEQEITLDNARDTFQANPSTKTANNYRAAALEYHADGMISAMEYDSILNETKGY